MTVRTVAKSTGIITAFVGMNGVGGSTGDLGPASLALLRNPQVGTDSTSSRTYILTHTFS